MTSDTTVRLCGQLVMGGFSGVDLPARYQTALAEGRRCGAILFRRNVEDLEQVAALNRQICAASEAPLIAVDQEGGRVARLNAPFIELPAMRKLAEADDLELTRAAAEEVGRQLAVLGFNLNFAPVMDVDSNPENPVIGDRAFGRDPRTVMRHGVAFIRGLQSHVLACAKHFPGHGDTSLDSHLDLPVVDHDHARLVQVEVPPFRAASGAGVACMMTAHVLYPALDEEPATLSRAVCGSLLRREIGFEGVLFCDDLEMGAIAQRHDVAEAAVLAVEAGCDVLLVCSDLDAQDRAHEALVLRCDSDERFRARCEEAASRVARIRQLCPPRPGTRDDIARVVHGPSTLIVKQRLRALGESDGGGDPTERA